MYFIALVAPEYIGKEALKWKLWMKEKYDCEVALKSPAHITLVPPFWMNPESENELAAFLDDFSLMQYSFIIQLKNFFHFGYKVIFIDVPENEEINRVRNSLFNSLLSAAKFPVKKDERFFHPHITIATRDLHKRAFHEAWEYFKEKNYAAGWAVENISLLKHDKKNWNVIHTFQFKKKF